MIADWTYPWISKETHMFKLPRASGEKHVAEFKRAGWMVNHVEGSHYVMVKEGSTVHLSIPVHRGKDLGIGLPEEADRESRSNE